MYLGEPLRPAPNGLVPRLPVILDLLHRVGHSVGQQVPTPESGLLLPHFGLQNLNM